MHSQIWDEDVKETRRQRNGIGEWFIDPENKSEMAITERLVFVLCNKNNGVCIVCVCVEAVSVCYSCCVIRVIFFHMHNSALQFVSLYPVCECPVKYFIGH